MLSWRELQLVVLRLVRSSDTNPRCISLRWSVNVAGIGGGNHCYPADTRPMTGSVSLLNSFEPHSLGIPSGITLVSAVPYGKFCRIHRIHRIHRTADGPKAPLRQSDAPTSQDAHRQP